MRNLILVLLILASVTSQAKPINYGDAVVSEIASIYDGDTFGETIKGWPAIIGERISIRVNGVDTSEMIGKCKEEKALAREAKQHTVHLVYPQCTYKPNC